MINLMIDIKRAVSDKRMVRFCYYRDGSLWYRTEFKEIFPVPIDDIGTATFNDTEKALLFMRYMRKFNEQMGVEINDK